MSRLEPAQFSGDSDSESAPARRERIIGVHGLVTQGRGGLPKVDREDWDVSFAAEGGRRTVMNPPPPMPELADKST